MTIILGVGKNIAVQRVNTSIRSNSFFIYISKLYNDILPLLDVTANQTISVNSFRTKCKSHLKNLQFPQRFFQIVFAEYTLGSVHKSCEHTGLHVTGLCNTQLDFCKIIELQVFLCSFKVVWHR